jgi:hypothetical protein
MMLYVQFDALGRAAVIYDTPRDGAEPVEGLDRLFLARHRRTDKGEWVAREAEPETEYQPTQEDMDAMREAEYQAALDAREAAVDAAIMSSDAYRSFIRGDMTLTAYRDAAAKIAAQFPMPER